MSKIIQLLNQIANYLKVPPGKITLDTFSLPVRSYNNVSVKGFLSIILSYVKESQLQWLGKSAEDKAEAYQWIEYTDTYLAQSSVSQITNELLPGLNDVLSRKTYLVANNLTIADVVLYYALQSVMENISYIEQEKFVNISRWFDNLQQDNSLRQKNKIIHFGTSYLSTIAPARH